MLLHGLEAQPRVFVGFGSSAHFRTLGATYRYIVAMLFPNRRLRVKTPAIAQAPLAELEDYARLENPNARCSNCLVMLPHPRIAMSVNGNPLKAPESFTREQLRDALLDACAHPEYQDARAAQRMSKVELKKLSVFKNLSLNRGRLHDARLRANVALDSRVSVCKNWGTLLRT